MNNTKNSNFYIEKSNLPTIKGKLFLRDNTGHCHSLLSVHNLLKSDIFRESNPKLIPIFNKAKAMMEVGETGIVNP
jgi:hypothetical protein